MIADGERIGPWTTDQRQSRLVFIGCDLDRAALRRGLRGRVVPERVTSAAR